MSDLITFISHHPVLNGSAFIVFILITVIELIRAKNKVVTLSPAAATLKINHQNALIIDLRTPDMYQKGHIINALSLPLAEIQKDLKKLEKYRNRPLIFICNTGNESSKMAASLLKQGYNAYALSGGMRAWGEEDMPIITEKS